jgi:hypothetical protein
VRDMGCYLEDYWAQVGAWAARFSWWSAVGCVGTRGGKICMGPMILCAAVLATSLVIGGVELNPGPVDSIVQVLCSGCDRNLSRELNANRVAGGIITAVEKLSFKLRRVEMELRQM